jgi:hypothetical protein
MASEHHAPQREAHATPRDTGLHLDPALDRAIAALAEKEGVSQQEMLHRLLREALATHPAAPHQD